MIDIVIAHKNTLKDREDNLKFSLSYYRKMIPTSNIIVSEVDTVTDIDEIKEYANIHLKLVSNTPYFSKSFVFNEGFKYVGSDYVAFIDSDCIIEESFFSELNNIKKILDSNVVLPFNPSVIDLTESQTESILSKKLNFLELSDLKKRIPSYGGVFLIKSENYMTVGGFDPRFIGYGAEDNAFIIKTNNFFPLVRLDYKVYHLYHQKFYDADDTDFRPKDVLTTKDNYYNNVRMLREYENFNREQTMEKIREIGFTHIMRIKY